MRSFPGETGVVESLFWAACGQDMPPALLGPLGDMVELRLVAAAEAVFWLLVSRPRVTLVVQAMLTMLVLRVVLAVLLALLALLVEVSSLVVLRLEPRPQHWHRCVLVTEQAAPRWPQHM